MVKSSATLTLEATEVSVDPVKSQLVLSNGSALVAPVHTTTACDEAIAAAERLIINVEVFMKYEFSF